MKRFVSLATVFSSFFVFIWALLLTEARNNPTFPERWYDLAILGRLFSSLGEAILTGIMAALFTSILSVQILSFFRNPSVLFERIARVLDIATLKYDNQRDSPDQADYSDIEERLNKIESNAKQNLTDEQFKALKEHTTNELTKSHGYSIIQFIEGKYGRQAVEGSDRKFLNEILGNIHDELTYERRVVSSRSGLNLGIGIVLGLAGVLTLYFTLIPTGPQEVQQRDIYYYVSRVALSILIQALAFFFLSLYKLGLQDIKFYRNEVTNIGLTKLGLNLALSKDTKDKFPLLAEKLLTAERNFLVKKGEAVAGQTSQSSPDAIDERTIGMVDKILEVAKKHFAPPEK